MSEAGNEAIQQFQSQMLGHAIHSLKTMPADRREMRGTMFPMRKESLPKAKALIRKFQEDFCDLLEDRQADAIFHLQLALFPVAETREK
jgi:hypothetical protein